MPGKAWTVGDLAHARTPAFQRRVSAALDVIREAATIGRIGVSFSGGKDSTALLDLVRQVVPAVPVAFFDSGCEHEQTYDTVRHYGAEFVMPEMSLLEMCRFGGYWGYEHPVEPDAEFDFFAFLVDEPSQRFALEHDLQVSCIGLRGQENKGRGASARSRGALYQLKDGMWHCCPLAFWTHDDVWAYIADRRLVYNAIYDRMAEIGVPREQWRVSTLLGMCGARWMGRYAYLRQLDPVMWARLAAEFPKIREYT